MKSKNGFTLVEVLAVISIVGVLLVLTVPAVLNIMNGSKNMLKGYEKDVLLDAAKYYLTDIDTGVKKYVYSGNGNTTVNGHVYAPGKEMTPYDAKTYIIETNGIDVTVGDLVAGGYYDKDCKYAGTTVNYRENGVEKTSVVSKDTNCTAPKNCKIHVSIVGRKVEQDKYYVTDDYKAELKDGCE